MNQLLKTHIKLKIYPSLTQEMVPVCNKAIKLAAKGQWDKRLSISSPFYKKRPTVKEFIEDMQLSDFVDLFRFNMIGNDSD